MGARGAKHGPHIEGEEVEDGAIPGEEKKAPDHSDEKGSAERPRRPKRRVAAAQRQLSIECAVEIGEEGDEEEEADLGIDSGNGKEKGRPRGISPSSNADKETTVTTAE